MRLAVAALAASLFLAVPVMAERPVEFVASPPADAALVLPLRNADHLGHAATTLNEPTRQAVARALASAEFDYKRGSTLSLRGIGAWPQILIVGMGEPPFEPKHLQDLGGTVAQQIKSSRRAAVLLSTIPSAGPQAGLHVATGALLGG